MDSSRWGGSRSHDQIMAEADQVGPYPQILAFLSFLVLLKSPHPGPAPAFPFLRGHTHEEKVSRPC